MLGYGVTKDRKLSEDVIRLIYRYAHLRLCKWSDLDFSECVDYGVLRSDLHNRIAEVLDCDRELVESVFTQAAEPFNCRVADGIVVDGTMKNDDDFTKIYDSFCDNLTEIALRENDELRHPNRITKDQLDEIAANPPLGMPDMINRR